MDRKHIANDRLARVRPDMKPFHIETPSGQNWSCHGCADCCRGLMIIELSEEEKARIEAQQWSKAEGVDPATMIVPQDGKFRLGHQPDGACVFLDSSYRCRIHARFGEEAKPRACRLFPLALHPMGKKLAVSVRFSCPSATANCGKPLSQQLPALRQLAELVVLEDYQELPAPRVLCKPGLGWPDFLRFVSWLDKTMAEPGKPVSIKLQRALHWLKAVEGAAFDQISGREADEILGALSRNAATEVSTFTHTDAQVSRVGGLLFRTLVFAYARKDTMKDLNSGGGYRIKMLWAMLRFARASGKTPNLHPELKSTTFTAIEKPFGPLPAEAEEMLTRFFRVKIQSLHFCGQAFYGMPLIEGFRNLALLFAVVIYLARWHAASEGRTSLLEGDVAQAIAIADHHHGYSPILGTSWSRKRAQLLAQRDDITRLCAAYGQ